LLVNLSFGEKQGSQSFSTPLIYSFIDSLECFALFVPQSFDDHIVCSLAVNEYSSIFLKNNRHSFSIAVKLDRMKYFVFVRYGAGLNTKFVVVIDTQILPAAVFCHVDESQLIRR